MSEYIHEENRKQPQDLIDPDPLSIFLSILGTVGSIASIVAYVEYQRNHRNQQREKEEKTRSELCDLFMALEVEHIELMGLLKGLEIILLKGSDHQLPLFKIRFEFGGCRPVFTYQGFRKYDETLLSINRKCGKLIELTSQILQRLYYYPLRVENAVFERLLKFRDRLNETMHRQMNYDEAFRVYEEIIHYGQAVSRDLREGLKKQY